VRDFIVRAGAELGMAISWRGVGRDEQGVDSNSGRVIVKIDPRYFRPTEVESLLGDASKAQRQLGWKSETSFETLVQEMVAADLAIARRDALVAREGFRTYQNRE
jgi:GDPmannose 4,6-dehydratase